MPSPFSSIDYESPNSLESKKMRRIQSKGITGKRMLDVGSNTGYLMGLLVDCFEESFGIELDSQSVEYCKFKFSKYPNMRFLCCDFRNMETKIEDKVFDLITCTDVLEHVTNRESDDLLKLLYSYLSSNGTILVTVPGFFDIVQIGLNRNPYHLQAHSSYGWARKLTRAGFKIVSIETVCFPIIDLPFLREHLHYFGKCCLIIAKKH